MIEIGLVVAAGREFQAIDEVAPVADDGFRVGVVVFHSREVVHDGDGAAVLAGGVEALGEYLVVVLQGLAAAGAADEALDEYAVDAVLLHPPEVQVGSGCVVAAWQVSGLSVGGCERGFVDLLVLADVGPEVDLAVAGGEVAVCDVVVPAAACAVVGCVEPALVARHDESLIRWVGGGLAVF
ncbi:hypothetical protein ACQ86N_30745 [Puia sp. P3]|uniref:hypothetical protein n=1 Tax=Puia sp. P3 TaxID=3423952 RepID=UPI003D67EF94